MVTKKLKKQQKNNQRKRSFSFLKHTIYAVPLPVLQPLLSKIVEHISRKRPEIFNRIGEHKKKSFLIDPTNLPFVFILKPMPDAPYLRAYRRRKTPKTNAQISGSTLDLLEMVDGRLDGDALFFSRKLSITGDTEAIVCLRNALDDLEGSIIEDIADWYGIPGHAVLKILRRIKHHGTKRHT